ncbi:MAG TPA: dihydrofolate reductase family protein [Phototrophicaceae bacterium]|jgi:dihydrofolate reductase|nr:dihydrofolate reductase family protein [Phototrophicaceae bacterium]
MRKLTAGIFISLDGVVEAPGSGDTTLIDKRGWSMPFTDQEVGGHIMGGMAASDAMLLGRITYENFAAYWGPLGDENPIASAMNNKHKYVVSTTLDKTDWKNSTLLKGDLVTAITQLKQQPGKDIAIVGSPTLVQSLLQLELIDELDLLICPVILGVGKRLFKEGLKIGTETRTMKPVSSKTYGSGMTILTLQPVRA